MGASPGCSIKPTYNYYNKHARAALDSSEIDLSDSQIYRLQKKKFCKIVNKVVFILLLLSIYFTYFM